MQPTQMALASAVEGSASVADPLSLNVLWPGRGIVQPFTLDLFKGYSRFRAATYTPSIPAIARLLEIERWDAFEVLFGHERLVGESDAASVVMLQMAIERSKTQGFAAAVFDDERRRAIADGVADGRVRFYTMSGGVSHNKIYLLEGERGRRALSGSANLSLTALSGRQAEVLFAFDDEDFVWDALSAIWDGLAERAPIPMDMSDLGFDEEIALARGVDSGDFPAFRHAEREGRASVIYTPAPDDYAGGVTGFAVNMDAVERRFGAAVRRHVKGGGGDVVKIEPATVKAFRRDSSRTQTDPTATEWTRLARTPDGIFVFNNRVVERPEDAEGIARDSLVIRRYFKGFEGFGANAALMQRVYFGLMGWLYFSPFMSRLKTDLQNLGGGEFASVQMMAICYGDSNCGKTSLIQFLMESMLGNHPALGNADFTPTKAHDLQKEAGLYPLFYDDLQSRRFTGQSDPAGDAIAKAYDVASSRMEFYPATIASLNTEARSFPDAFRKRAAFFFASSALPLSDVELNKRTAREMREVKNQIGRDFYAEYLHRMAGRVDALNGDTLIEFDYMRASTELIIEMMRESIVEGEILPAWASEPLDTNSVFQQHLDEIRGTVANRLRSEYMSRTDPPEPNYWIERRADNQLIVGVEDARRALGERVYPDEIVLRQHSQGSVLTLDAAALTAFMQRGGAEFANWRIPRRGALDWLRRLGR